MKSKSEKTHLVFRILEYGQFKEPFTLEELIEDLQLQDYEQRYVTNSLVSRNGQTSDPNHILVKVFGHGKIIDNKQYEVFALLPSAVMQYVDYLEILEARENSKKAYIISMWALGISLGVGLIQIILQVISMAK
jgi:hypothetical protein